MGKKSDQSASMDMEMQLEVMLKGRDCTSERNLFPIASELVLVGLPYSEFQSQR